MCAPALLRLLHRFMGTGWQYNRYNVTSGKSENWTVPGGWSDCDARLNISIPQVQGEQRLSWARAGYSNRVEVQKQSGKQVIAKLLLLLLQQQQCCCPLVSGFKSAVAIATLRPPD